MKKPIINQYDRHWMRESDKDPAWRRYELLRACKDLKLAILEEVEPYLMPIIKWLDKKLK